ncbi:c-type cytochrome [Paraflavisolibacter sp. H34]|uniref:c-type cytochrome n=1 Tax=Huijunlia imazamoxiresistens TaxID=3127457 RepID=UPI00301B5C5E
MKRIYSSLLTITISGLIFVACSKDDEQTVSQPDTPAGGGNTCVTANMKFSTDIKPILQANCFACHGNGLTRDGVNLDTYANVKTVADNGRLVGAITHASGFTPMPRNAPKLSDCDISKIQAWIAQGTKDN